MTWIELFFDLVFVAAVAQVGVPLVSDYSFQALGRYAFLLSLIWWAWNGYAMYATRFDPDDGLQRALTLLQMVAVIFMAANAEDGLASDSSAGFVAAYAVMRVVLVVQYLRALAIPAARRLAAEYALGFGTAGVFWLVSALTPAPARYVLWGAAALLEVGTALMASRHTERLPPDASHLPERFGLFTLILLGESIVAVMKGIQGQPEWTMSAAGAALFGTAFVFALWWWYFDGAGAAGERMVRTRRDVRRLELWNIAHLPLYFGLALSAVGIEAIVKSGARGPLDAETAWVLCGSAALVMSALTVLTATRGRSPRGGFGVGLLVSLSVFALPLAHEALPAAGVVAVLASLGVAQAALSRMARSPGGVAVESPA